MFAYTVRCTFDDPALRDEWVAWIAGGHAQDVIDAGALSADVVVLDGAPAAAEVRYRFSDRAAFDAYERDHAPRLREDGLARFPLERGLRYERSTGELRRAATGSA